MKKTNLLAGVLFGIATYGQVGINTTTPVVTLDVSAKTTDGTASEGFKLPNVTGNALHAADTAGLYGVNHNATLVYVTEAPDPVNRVGQVEGMDEPGFYYYNAGINRWLKVIVGTSDAAYIGQLQCSSASNFGLLTNGVAASGVNTTVPYTGGNGAGYSAQVINSTGVTGLIALLSSGSLAVGNGFLNFTITGTPASAGTANFEVTIGGETCSFMRTVAAPAVYPTSVDVLVNGVLRKIGTYNLGADTSLDPTIPVKGINGNYYQWGRTLPIANADTQTGAISGFSTAQIGNKAWNSGTEASPVKTANDPCPAGFRVPTRTEWKGFLLNSSSVSSLGTWSTSGTNGAANFGAAKVFINNGNTVVFPISGMRYGYSSGSLQARGFIGHYWSNIADAPVAGVNQGAFTFRLESTNVLPEHKFYVPTGFPIRCINQ